MGTVEEPLIASFQLSTYFGTEYISLQDTVTTQLNPTDYFHKRLQTRKQTLCVDNTCEEVVGVVEHDFRRGVKMAWLGHGAIEEGGCRVYVGGLRLIKAGGIPPTPP